jgi:hypothetical protein
MSSEGDTYHGIFTEPEEGWQNPVWTPTGDFYREPDDVVRGVQFGNLSDPVRHPAGIAHDFYHDSADLKSHALLPDSLGSGCGGLLPSSDPDLFPEASFKAFGSGYDPDELTSPKYHSTFDLPHRFVPGDEPPFPPTDEYWKYEVTTLHVKTAGPHESYKIGNHLLAFLHEQVVSSIRKVRSPSETNFQKFSIKADVFIENIMCTLKIRVYRDTREGWYFVEFQRRSGDCVSFNTAYQNACTYLRTRLGASAGWPDSFAPVQPQPQQHDGTMGTMGVVVSQDEITPLLDMASMKQMPSLQAESATALAGLAQDNTRATLLCNNKAFDQFKNLLVSNQTVVAYPTARILFALAQCAEATRYFAEQGILPAILDKVRSEGTSALVQKHLMQTLSIAVARCVPLLSDMEVGVLLDGLSAAAKAGPAKEGLDTEGEKAFYRSLQDTKSTLQYKQAAARGARIGAGGGASLAVSP